MNDVSPNFRMNVGSCGCDEEECEEYGTYRRKPSSNGKLCVKTCTKCKSCRGGFFSKRGNKGQRKVAEVLRVPLQGLGGGWEQFWRACWRVEVKEDIDADRVAEFYRTTKHQSDKDHAFGDVRPYVAIAKQGKDIYAVIHIEAMDNAATAWLESRQ